LAVVLEFIYTAFEERSTRGNARVLAALADAPYYFLTDSVFAWEQIVTFITAAFVYYLYVAYAEEVAVEAERGAEMRPRACGRWT
jgi:hypothetical protein